MYGLKQASRQLNAKLTKTLLTMGFKQSWYGYSLFVKHHGEVLTLLLVYVDDILVLSNSIEVVVDGKHHDLFKIKNLGEAKYFLGMEITRVCVTQRKYVLDMLQDSSFLYSEPAAPMETTLKVSLDDSELMADNTAYRSLIGKLLYLTITRLDLTYPLQQLPQFLDKLNLSALEGIAQNP